MKKRLCILVAALLMMTLTALCSGSLAAADYVSIKELRESAATSAGRENMLSKTALPTSLKKAIRWL